jgi:hypothetical protein
MPPEMLLQVDKDKIKLIELDYIQQFSRVKKTERKQHHESTSSLNIENAEFTIKSTLSEKSASFSLLKVSAHKELATPLNLLDPKIVKSADHLTTTDQDNDDSMCERSSVRSDRTTEYLETEFLSQSNLALEQIAAAMEKKPKCRPTFIYFVVTLVREESCDLHAIF